MEYDNNQFYSKRSLGIREKLFIGFATIILIFLVVVIVTLYFIYKTENFSKNVINYDLPIYSAIVDLNASVQDAQNSLQLWLLTQDVKYKSENIGSWDKVQNSMDKVDSLINGAKNNIQDNIQKIKPLLNELKNSQLKIMASTDKTVYEKIFYQEDIPKFKYISTLLNVTQDTNTNSVGLVDQVGNELSIKAQQLISDMNLLKIIEIVMVIFAIILSIIITMQTARLILPPLNKAIRIAKRISMGDRNVHVDVASNDETGRLLASLKVMQQKIKQNEKKLEDNEEKSRELFEKIVKSAKSFSAHSSRVAAGDLRENLKLTENDIDVMIQLGNDLNKMTQNLASLTNEIIQACHHMVTTVDEVHYAIDAQSAGAAEQASSVNEITTSLSEIEKSSAQTLIKAKALGESAERTREKGQLGLTSVDQSVEGMKSVRDKVQLIAQTILDLSQKTQQVGEITSVVNNLAQQSKMLALNAAIEASKAGEAGKGFAVVASEVKNLAEQSEQATTQVQKMLEDIRQAAEKAVMVTEEGTKEVDVGTQLVSETGDIIRTLNDVIHETTVSSQQIESAVRQESAGIEQITSGMTEINKVTSSFVESVKQTTDAISNLAEIAKSLKSYIDTYKI